MIEKLFPIEIPPGIVSNGTMYERMGRWADGNLVRFVDGHPAAIGLAGAVSTTPSALSGGAPGGAYVGATPSADFGLLGCASKLWAFFYSAANVLLVDDATPAGGVSSYGNNVWSFARLGLKTIASRQYGRVWEYTSSPATDTVCPIVAGAMCVTPERFLMVFNFGKVQWASQGTTTTWTPSSTNSAGSLDIASQGAPMTAFDFGGETFHLTTQELWKIPYVGAPIYYGAARIGAQCGAIAARAAAVLGSQVVWMGTRGFFRYNGYVQPLPCSLSESIFSDINHSQRDLIHAVVNAPLSEIWWYYPAAGATEANRLVIYNYAQDVWTRGTRSQAAGSDALWPASFITNAVHPVMLSFTTGAEPTVTALETGGAIAGAYIETGPILLDKAGGQLMRVQKIVPDNAQTAAAETLTLYTGTWPKVAEASSTHTIAAAGGEIDVRATARYVRLKFELTRSDSRVGTPRLGVVPDGLR